MKHLILYARLGCTYALRMQRCVASPRRQHPQTTGWYPRAGHSASLARRPQSLGNAGLYAKAGHSASLCAGHRALDVRSCIPHSRPQRPLSRTPQTLGNVGLYAKAGHSASLCAGHRAWEMLVCMPKQATAPARVQATELNLFSTCRFYLLAQARPKGAKRWIPSLAKKR